MFKKINIPRKNWYRGQGSQGSQLLVADNESLNTVQQLCCVGLMSRQLGIEERLLKGRPELGNIWSDYAYSEFTKQPNTFLKTVREVVEEVCPEWHEKLVTEKLRAFLKENGWYSYEARIIEVQLYFVNDQQNVPDTTRELLLTALFGELGLDVVFFDEEIDFMRIPHMSGCSHWIGEPCDCVLCLDELVGRGDE